jgi:antitoxin PrlF
MMKDEIMLSLFLDFIVEQALSNPTQELEAYTEAMAEEDDALMAGVSIFTD